MAPLGWEGEGYGQDIAPARPFRESAKRDTESKWFVASFAKTKNQSTKVHSEFKIACINLESPLVQHAINRR